MTVTKILEEPTLNELIDRDPLALTQDDITKIVAHYRAARDTPGPRPKKETGPTAKLDLSTLSIKAPAPTSPQIKRRF